MKFQILVGSHIHEDGFQYDAPAVIETNVDLERRFNSRGSEKFRKVDAATPVTKPNFTVPVDAPQKSQEEIFNEMTIDDLKRYASEHKIKFPGNATKEVLINVIKTASLQDAAL